MRLSEERVRSLQALLSKEVGLELTNEQTQEAGVTIMRFVIAKAQRKQELIKSMENHYGRSKVNKEA